MKQQVTKAIVLTRTNYGEADRIVTFLTPDQGKLRLMAKGVRKPKSKLAGGVELFSISDLTYVRGRGDIGTLISARLDTHFRHIVEDIDRTMLGYECIKQIHKATEDAPEPLYFQLLVHILTALDEGVISPQVLQPWFSAQLLAHGGYSPELHQDARGNVLNANERYLFDYDTNSFIIHEQGKFEARHIKLLRILFADLRPMVAWKVHGISDLLPDCSQLIQTLVRQYIRQ